MSENCNPEYKNLESIISSSEQGYGTVQWARQNCKNDEWLRRNVEEVRYLTPPAIRKRFAPILVDALESYGYQYSNGINVIFSNSTSDEISIDFQDMSLIDRNKSSCDFESYVDNDGTHLRAVVPMETVQNTDYTVRNHQGGGLNSFWYVGFDKNKTYQVRPDWIKDNFDHEIPSVCRAQTFTIPNNYLPTGTVGKLVSVDLKIENNGVNCSNWGSPLYVQIFRTEKRRVEKTWWDKKAKKNKSYNPKQYENIWWPVGHPHNALATASFQPDKTNPSWQNFLFDKAVEVKNGEHYALVFLSPLSHWEHCPRVGGWGRNCATDKYAGGDAFLSENNGRSWIRYGRNDDKVPGYKFGKYTPLDFAFQCHIDKFTTGRDTDEEYYLYLKPILANPITSFKINGDSVVGETEQDRSEGKLLYFEYSINGRDWSDPIRSGEWKYFDKSTQILFVRARMKTDSSAKTPNIERMSVEIRTELPKEMYVRTHFYNPRVSPMLGAALWGRIFAPFELSPNDENITASVELIQNRLVTEHFTIISVSDLDYYLELLDNEKQPILDEENILGVEDKLRAKYLNDNPDVLTKLKTFNIYVKPYIEEEDNISYYLSFDGGLDDDNNQIIAGLNLTNSPAYPIQECLLQPDGGDEVISLGEWYDYNIDYDNDLMTLEETLLNNLATGSLGVSYNPVFIQDLTIDEVGTHVDEDTGLNVDGLILDYFKETFDIGELEVESRSVKLKCAPVDPIRSVVLNKNAENETELKEDIDFNVDYDNNEIIFPIVNIDNQSSILQINDTVTVVYTPNLEDTSIAIGYRARRTDTSHQCIIKPNYYEYKV